MADNKYTVTTPHGDVNLTTPHDHLDFASIEAFLKEHQATISSAVGVTSVAIGTLGLYLSHGRGGPKLR